MPSVLHPNHRSEFYLPSQHAFQQSPFNSLHASPSLSHEAQEKRQIVYNDVSSGSSGYHSGARHTGVITKHTCRDLCIILNVSVAGQCRSDPQLCFSWCVTGAELMEEHLREIRSLHRRLEDSIQTNECLRQQLAGRLGSKIQDGGLRITLHISLYFILIDV